MILTWSLVILIMALAQNRFTYYYAINVAILTGFLVTWLLQRFGITDLDLDVVKDPAKLIILKSQDHPGGNFDIFVYHLAKS